MNFPLQNWSGSRGDERVAVRGASHLRNVVHSTDIVMRTVVSNDSLDSSRPQ
jgi:hypothetical protein